MVMPSMFHNGPPLLPAWGNFLSESPSLTVASCLWPSQILNSQNLPHFYSGLCVLLCFLLERVPVWNQLIALVVNYC
jgi:hypothetical protein